MTDAPPFDTARFQNTLVAEAVFTEGQARVPTRAMADATGHLPSSSGLEQFKAEMKALIAEKANDQTWKVMQIISGAVLLNSLLMVGIAVGLYNALKA